VASASDAFAIIWDAASGNELARLSGHKEKISALAFDASGAMLATAAGRSVKLWSVTDPRPGARDLPPYETAVVAVTFRPDGKVVAVGMDNGTVVLSDTASGQELAPRLEGHQAKLTGISFSRDGSLIATVGIDRKAKLWNASTGTLLRTLSGHTGAVEAVSFSSDARQLATGSADRTVRLWDTETGSLTMTMAGHTAAVKTVAFLNIKQQVFLASTSDDRTARLWDPKTGKSERTLRGHTARVQDIAVHPQHNALLTAAADKTVRTHPSTDSDVVRLARSQLRRTFTYEECVRYELGTKNCELSKLATEGKKRWDDRKYAEAMAIYNKVHQQDSKHVPASTWNELCWDAAKSGAAAAVVDSACERAVTLSSALPMYVDSRGLARALTGRRDGAIRDFSVYVDSVDADPKERDRRIQWIAELKAGRNPFTRDVLASL
jgi:WD40 repeat protein